MVGCFSSSFELVFTSFSLLSHLLAHHSLSGMDVPSRYERDLNRPNFGHLGCRKGLCLSTVLNQLYFQFARVVYRRIVRGVDRTGMILKSHQLIET